MNFIEYVKDNIVILDGALGTQFQSKGMPAGKNPEYYNIEDPALVEEIHRGYVQAGSDVIYTNTFGANRVKLGDGKKVAELVSAAVEIARRAAGNKFVALDIGPTGALLEPLGSMTQEEAYDIFAEIVRAGSGADLIVIETMSDLAELRAALLAARENSTLPVMCSMTFEEGGRTFTGVSAEAFALTASPLADVIGVNCSLGPDKILPIMKRIASHTAKPLFIKANAGLPDENMNYSVGAREFAAMYNEYLEIGVNILGGCCGTTPGYIAEIKKIAKGKKPKARKVKVPAAVCSASEVVYLDRVRVIGERINPTGKKAMKEALLKGDMGYVAARAIEQVEAGADILDVNAGVPGIDEKAVLCQMVKRIQSAVEAPLQIDCGKPEAIEAALRAVSGKAIVNSVNAEEGSLNSILPVVAKYGAAVVGLAVDERGIPSTVEGRLENARKIIKRAKEAGIPEQDIYIDCLTLTVSAEQNQALNTLEAVRRIREEYEVHAVLGVSNISFGLPARGAINSSFLTLAMQAGLDLPIINPNIPEMMAAVRAFNVLTCADKGCAEWVERYAQTAVPAAEATDINKDIYYYISKGLPQAAELTREKLNAMQPLEVIDELLIPALNRVGDDYEKGVIFLPQLISAAEAAKLCFEEVKSRIKGGGIGKGDIVLATVFGDVHDIGKNIVKTVLENYGYNVIDLGKNVPPQTVVEAVKKGNIRLCGLSALMTTTVENMKKTIELLRENCPGCKIMVGGAVLTEEYAEKIGADKYCKDAAASARYAEEVFSAAK